MTYKYSWQLSGLLSTQERENLYKIQRKWDVITDNWTLLALKCLQLINSRYAVYSFADASIDWRNRYSFLDPNASMFWWHRCLWCPLWPKWWSSVWPLISILKTSTAPPKQVQSGQQCYDHWSDLDLNAGKEDIFARIVNKFGKKCTYVVIGDGRDEEMAAQKVVSQLANLIVNCSHMSTAQPTFLAGARHLRPSGTSTRARTWSSLSRTSLSTTIAVAIDQQQSSNWSRFQSHCYRFNKLFIKRLLKCGLKWRDN